MLAAKPLWVTPINSRLRRTAGCIAGIPILSFPICVVASPDISLEVRWSTIAVGSSEVREFPITDQSVRTWNDLEYMLRRQMVKEIPETKRLETFDFHMLTMNDITGNWETNIRDSLSSTPSIISPFVAIIVDDTGASPTTATQRMPPMLFASIFTVLHPFVSSKLSK
eukprot:GHVU01000925.1.p1 GENE.GHVU01000925.1~~GHVU01000925.1.p1  ORF type:complete len:168 (-),score=1.37 GHVU01000925.1:404-907(-)